MDSFSLPSMLEISTSPNGYKHCNVILEQHGSRLWLGDLSSAEDVQFLKRNNIRTGLVITASQGFNLTYEKGIHHYVYGLYDSKKQNVMQYLDEADRRINAGLRVGDVLVHCAAGVSRSATLVIAYLIKSHKMTFQQALKHCKKHRPETCPNLGFERQLKIYEKTLKSKDISTLNSTLSNVLKLSSLDNNISQLPQLTIARHKRTDAPKRLDIHRDLSGIGCGGGGISRLTMMKRTFTDLKDRGAMTPSQKRQQYLRKVAEFRFGITSLGRFGEENGF